MSQHRQFTSQGVPAAHSAVHTSFEIHRGSRWPGPQESTGVSKDKVLPGDLGPSSSLKGPCPENRAGGGKVAMHGDIVGLSLF